MLGTFGSYYLYYAAGLNWIIALVLTLVFISLLGVLIEAFVFRPLKGALVSAMVMAFGLSHIIQGGAALVFGRQDRNVPPFLSGQFSILGVNITVQKALIAIAAIVLIAGLHLFLWHTRQGLAIRAVAEEPEGAELQGININFIRSLTFVISVCLAAVGGMIAAPSLVINPYIGGIILKIGMVVVIGGMGTIMGALVGGLFVGFIESIGYMFIGEFSTTLVFLAVIFILATRPQGIVGSPLEVQRE
jgi:branched-chain amino acid transport system permease protein